MKDPDLYFGPEAPETESRWRITRAKKLPGPPLATRIVLADGCVLFVLSKPRCRRSPRRPDRK